MEDSIEKPLTSFDYYEPKTSIIKKAMPWLIACGIGILVVLAIILAIVYSTGLDKKAVATTTSAPTTSYSQLSSVGSSCSTSSDCVATAFCNSSVCACSPQLYYDSTNQVCSSRKTYGQSCSTSSECEYFVFLSCINNQCDCDPTYFFWNPVTLTCQDRVGLGQPCSGVSENECFTSALTCIAYNGQTTKTCLCPSASLYYSFQFQSCMSPKGQGVTCNGNAHFECVQNAWCTTIATDTTNRCYCYPTYYWDSSSYSCKAKVFYGQSCSYSYQCYDYQGQTCVSSSNTCGCPTGTFWNQTNCDPQKPYGGVCNKTSDCLYPGLVCIFRPETQDYGCMCQNGQYFSLVNNSCVNFLNIGDVCTDTYQCTVNATCSFQSGSSTKTCTCAQNFFYRVGTTNQCLPLKNYTATCSSSSECNSLIGLICLGNICTCDPLYFFNGVECEVRKSVDSFNYGVYCVDGAECKSVQGNCFNGKCSCAPTKTYNPATNLC